MRRTSSMTPASGRAIGRRALLAGGLAAAGLGLAGCGAAEPAARGRTLVRQWNLFTGGDGVRMVEMHDRFGDSHPDIELRPTSFLWGNPFYTKFTMGAAGGRAFDVATVHLSRLRGLGAGTLIEPVPRDLLAEHGITPDRVLPAVWDKCVVDGEVYAIPLDTHLCVTYFNREVCRKAGVLDGDGQLVAPSGPEEFVDLLAAVKDVTGRYGGVLETTGAWRQFWSLYRQLGGAMEFGHDGVSMDDDKALRVLDFLRRLAEDGLVPTASDAPGTPANFQNGIAGVMLGGDWELSTFRDAGMDFGMRPYPGIFGDELGQGDSHAFVLPRRQEPAAQTVQAAVGYAAWMTTHSLPWAGGGHIPAHRPVTESSGYDALEPQSSYRAAAEDVQFDPDAWFSGSAAQLQNEADSVFASMFSGDATPEVALARFRRTARRLAATPEPV